MASTSISGRPSRPVSWRARPAHFGYALLAVVLHQGSRLEALADRLRGQRRSRTGMLSASPQTGRMGLSLLWRTEPQGRGSHALRPQCTPHTRPQAIARPFRGVHTSPGEGALPRRPWCAPLTRPIGRSALSSDGAAPPGTGGQALCARRTPDAFRRRWQRSGARLRSQVRPRCPGSKGQVSTTTSCNVPGAQLPTTTSCMVQGSANPLRTHPETEPRRGQAPLRGSALARRVRARRGTSKAQRHAGAASQARIYRSRPEKTAIITATYMPIPQTRHRTIRTASTAAVW